MEITSLVISILAICISIATFWLTRLKKGTIKMTKPTVIFLGPDGIGSVHKKVFIRTLLYSTNEQGRYIQNMYIRLQRGETIQNFNIWVYDNNGLVRGSGLFINKSGLSCNHHFLLPRDGLKYEFLGGEYLMQVFVEPINHSPIKLFEHKLFVTDVQQNDMQNKKAGIYFDWAPNSQDYTSHIDEGPETSEKLNDFTDMILKGSSRPKRR